MNALDSPLIQLGFYWHVRDQVECYRCLLRWILTQGYEMLPKGLAFRAIEGVLPPFSQTSLAGIQGVESLVFTDWTAERALHEEEWLPVRIHLLPKCARGVKINLGYAGMAEPCLDQDAHHAIEVVASGADMDLVENVPASQLPAKVVAGARRTARWQRDFFELTCRDCAPDYAGCFWEWELQPPCQIARSRDLSDFDGLYFPQALARRTKVGVRLASLRSWSVRVLGEGVIVRCKERGTAEAEKGMVILRGAIGRAFPGQGKVSG